MKKILRRMFVDQHAKLYNRTNNFFALLTIISIVSLVLETVPELAGYHSIFLMIEWLAVSLFAFEYLGRLIVSRPLHSYPLSFFGIIDLVAILPTFLGLGNFTFLKSARAFRIIRLLRMMRLAKISRTNSTRNESMGILSLNIIIYFATLLIALLLTGTAMYMVEPEHPAFISIPAGMWWALKIFIGGADIAAYPETFLGEVFFLITSFVGLLLLGLLIGVVGNVFQELLLGKDKRSRTKTQ